MTTFLEIEKHLITAWEILVSSRQLATDSQAMLMTDNATFSAIQRNNFLRGIGELKYNLAVIELSKLFSNSQSDHYCIRRLLTDLKSNHSKTQWSNRITISEIESLQNSYSGALFERKIQDLIILRSNYLAHTSKKPPKKQLQTYFSDLLDLIMTGEGIVNKLSTKILNKPVKFPQYDGNNAISFFKEYMETIRLAGLYNFHYKK